MEFSFYICGLIAVLASLRVVSEANPIHALLYLILSLLAVAGVFFSLGAYFAGALEVIVYAGAVMVLFVFVLMMLNLGKKEQDQERAWLTPKAWIGPSLLSAVLLGIMGFLFLGLGHTPIDVKAVGVKVVGISLFGPYILSVELASMLLLGALVAAFHIGRSERDDGGYPALEQEESAEEKQ